MATLNIVKESFTIALTWACDDLDDDPRRQNTSLTAGPVFKLRVTSSAMATAKRTQTQDSGFKEYKYSQEISQMVRRKMRYPLTKLTSKPELVDVCIR